MNTDTITRKGRINNVSVERNSDGSHSFVLHLIVAATATVAAIRDYFRIPLGNEDSLRIGSQQLRNALPPLMPFSGMQVVREMLLHKSKFIGTEVEYLVVPQKSKDGTLKLNPTTGEPYTNIRLTPSTADLSPEIVDALLSEATALTGPVATPATADDDVQM